MILQHGNTSDSWPFPLVPLGFFLSILFFQLMIPRLRARSLRALAARRGMQFLDRELPGIYPAEALAALPDWDAPRNVIYGELDGDLLLAFDVSIGFGRGRYTMTVVARRCKVLHRCPRLNDSISYNQTDCWHSVFYRARWLATNCRMSAGEIEDIWGRLHAPHPAHSGAARPKLTPVADNTLIRPRRQHFSL